MKTKVCSKCKEEKPVEGFSKIGDDIFFEKCKECFKAYNEASRLRAKRNARSYYEANKEKIKQSYRKYQSSRIKKDINFKICKRLRTRIHGAVLRNQKKGSAVRDLGVSVEELKSHLETLFTSEMTWENWGKVWHLDHIYPLAKANLSDRVEFLAVANWRNLQPLSVEENLQKNDKVTPEAQALFDELCEQFREQEAAA